MSAISLAAQQLGRLTVQTLIATGETAPGQAVATKLPGLAGIDVSTPVIPINDPVRGILAGVRGCDSKCLLRTLANLASRVRMTHSKP